MKEIMCDVCGGDITMLSTGKTYCLECGKIFDSRLINSAIEDIKREAEIIYLEDIRTLETIVYNTEKCYNHIQKNIKSYKQSYLYEYDKLKNTKIIQPPRQIKDRRLICSIIWALLPSILITFFIGGCMTMLPNSDTSINNVIGKLIAIPILFIFIFLISWAITYAHEDTEYNEEAKKYNRDLETFIAQQNTYNNLNNEYIFLKNHYEKYKKESEIVLSELSNEYNDYKKKLNKAYGINIIPKQFRNIRSIYYLYDYMSTSKQSLSEALLHADMESIKDKIDKMIQLQSKQIILQAQSNAKLDSVKRNTEMISYEIRKLNENFLAYSNEMSQYANMITVNSELNNKLMSESLAIQKYYYWYK